MCLTRRVPLLLARGAVRLVVVDSLAALFRCEFQAADWMERTKQMLTVASTLHRLSQEFSTPVLCINQVPAGREGGTQDSQSSRGHCDDFIQSCMLSLTYWILLLLQVTDVFDSSDSSLG